MPYLDDQLGFEQFYCVVVFDKEDKCYQAKTFYSLLEAMSFQKILIDKYTSSCTIEIYRFNSTQICIENGNLPEKTFKEKVK